MSTTMTNISAAQVKELREKTGAPMMDCKQALTEAKGDMEAAVVVLRKKGVSVAAKKATRATSEGSVTSYIHAGGKIGVLREVDCASDFVARTEDFKELVHDIAMHIAASDPNNVRKEDVTDADFAREKEIFLDQAIKSGKPANIAEKMVTGKMEKFYEEVCLLEQPFIKDQTISISQLIAAKIGKLGENIAGRRFARFKVGAAAGGQGFGVDPTRIHEIAAEIGDVHKLGVQIAIVVGGGNFFRGVAQQAKDMDRVSADHMGMLATVINGLALQDALEKQSVYTRVQTAIEMTQVAEPFIRRRAIRHLEKGRVVIFAGGTGNPYFSTDTAASLRAMEIKADAILKATKVDGIYDADPMKGKDPKKFSHLPYMDA